MEYALENASSSNFEDLESAEKWFADCFKDTEMQICPDNPYASKSHCKFMAYIYIFINKLIL
jgi:hypothetical protein